MSLPSSPVPSSPTSGKMRSAMIFWLLGGLLVLAPLYRAGNRPLPALLLELGALLLLVAAFWPSDPPQKKPLGLGMGEILFLVLLFLFPALYLIPLPGFILSWLPGREPYVTGLELLGIEASTSGAQMAIDPLATESAWLRLLLPIAGFLGARLLPATRLLQLVSLLFAVATLQALLGLMQFGQGAGSPLYWGMTHTHFGSGVGTYDNRNHLAGLLEMVLPVALALLIYSVGRRSGRQASGNWRHQAAFFSTLRGHAAFRYGALSLLLLTGLIFTRSRTGLALAMVGILLVTFALSRRIGGESVRTPIKTILALALAVAVSIGLVPILDRFTTLDPMEDLRWALFSATLHGIGALFPLGSGPGSYEAVFPAFQPLELGHWQVDYAHNDYLHWLFEGGLVVGLLLLLLLILYLARWRALWTPEAWSRLRFVQVGAGIGLLLLACHELLDYNLHMPANMLYFAFLMGVFFSDADAGIEASGTRRRRRKRHTPDLESTLVRPLPQGPAPAPAKHPFAD